MEEEIYEVNDEVEVIESLCSCKKGMKTSIKEITSNNGDPYFINIFYAYNPKGEGGNSDNGYNVPKKILKKVNKISEIINNYQIY